MSWFEIPRRVWIAYFLGLSASVVMAAVYTFGGGPELPHEMKALATMDSMWFTSFALSLSLLGGGIYYVFSRDVSTSLAPVLGVLTGLYSGLEDIVVYVFCTFRDTGDCVDVTGLPESLPWLADGQIGWMAEILGFNGVTGTGLVAVTMVFIFLSLVFLKILVSFETRFGGVDL